MAKRRLADVSPRPVSDDWWDEPLWMNGNAHAVSDTATDSPPTLWVPDAERGGFKQQPVLPRKPRLGFR